MVYAGMPDATPTHLLSACGAGVTAVIFGSPLDLLTTRQMNNPGMYKGPADVIAKTIGQEGITALYKGFIPNVTRLAGFNMVLWFTMEKFRRRLPQE